jgi:hypothetical protein
MAVGVFSGRSRVILSSGKTTAFAQVSSVVRVKTSEAGPPFFTSTLLGVNPLASTMTGYVAREALEPGAALTVVGGEMAGELFESASAGLLQPAMSTRLARAARGDRCVIRDR